MELIRQLNELAARHELEKQAFEGIRQVLDADDLGLDPAVKKQLAIRFKHHKLCFKHGAVDAFIETTLSIDLDVGEVGYYSLFSDLQGQSFDDALVIDPEDLCMQPAGR